MPRAYSSCKCSFRYQTNDQCLIIYLLWLVEKRLILFDFKLFVQFFFVLQCVIERYTADLERPIDPMSEAFVTVGASAALFCAIQAVVDKGDEVILFEPAFDIYEPQVSCSC